MMEPVRGRFGDGDGVRLVRKEIVDYMSETEK
jgi:hypothetical protein